MYPESIEPQECYFYQGHWDEDTVNVFIRVLMDDVKTGIWNVDGDNVDLVKAAVDFVNVKMDKDFAWDDTVGLMTLLKKRYKTFKAILEFEGVLWDRRINRVYSNNWEAIFKEDEYAKAFYHNGDLMYDNLKELFCDGKIVIDISSDCSKDAEHNSPFVPIIIPDSDNEQEVESPVAGARTIPRKKLFDDLGSNTCQALFILESKTYVPAESQPVLGKKTTKSKGAVVEMVKESSSCASWSPHKLDHSPLTRK